MKFNEKLVFLRKKYGYSQEKLAELLGVTRQAISRWELGDTTPEMELLVALCKTFNVSADYLIHDDQEEVIFTTQKNKKKSIYLLIATIAFTFAALCSFVGIILSNNEMQLILSCFNEVVLIILAIINFKRYKKTVSIETVEYTK